MAGGLGTATAIRSIAPFAFRYQYLAGGAGAGKGWQAWERGNATFVGDYTSESRRAGLVPIFTYYMLLHTTAETGTEPERLKAGLADPAVMRAWFDDLRTFFQRANGNELVVLHVEPDLWGFLQQASGTDGHQALVRVSSTGLEEFAGLPDDATGLAQGIVRLRDRYAPNVALGYHLSAWATGIDPFLSNTTERQTAEIARKTSVFYQSLQADFDIVFTEFSDRDAGFKQHQYSDRGASWWDEADFARHVKLISGFRAATGLPVVVWQIPLGNTKFRAMDNTWNHYQDNRVEWLLDAAAGEHLSAYRDAGVVALFFGRGADGATDATDAAKDGVTNPVSINGNTRESISAADDGGYFAERAVAYYAAGPLGLEE